MGTAVVAHSDAAPILQAPKHDLDFMPLFIKGFIVVDGNLAVFFAGNAGGDAAGPQAMTEPIGIITAIGEQGAGLREMR